MSHKELRQAFCTCLRCWTCVGASVVHHDGVEAWRRILACAYNSADHIGGRGQCPLAWCVLLHQPNVCVAPPIAGITRLGFVQFVEATVNRNSFSNCIRRNDIVVCIRHGDIQFCTNKKFTLHRDVVAGSRSGFCLWP